MFDRKYKRNHASGSPARALKRLLNSGKLLALLIAAAGVFAASSAIWASAYGTLFLVISIFLFSVVLAIATHKIRRIAINVREVKNELIAVRSRGSIHPLKNQESKDLPAFDNINATEAVPALSMGNLELRDLSEKVEEMSRRIRKMALSVASHVHPRISSLTAQTLQSRMRHARPRSLTFLDYDDCETLVKWLASDSPNHVEVTAHDAHRKPIELAVAEVLVVDLTGSRPEKAESIQMYGQLIGRNEVWIIGDSSMRNIVVQKIQASDRTAELVVVGDEKIELTIMRKGI